MNNFSSRIRRPRRADTHKDRHAINYSVRMLRKISRRDNCPKAVATAVMSFYQPSMKEKEIENSLCQTNASKERGSVSHVLSFLGNNGVRSKVEILDLSLAPSKQRRRNSSAQGIIRHIGSIQNSLAPKDQKPWFIEGRSGWSWLAKAGEQIEFSEEPADEKLYDELDQGGPVLLVYDGWGKKEQGSIKSHLAFPPEAPETVSFTESHLALCTGYDPNQDKFTIFDPHLVKASESCQVMAPSAAFVRALGLELMIGTELMAS